MQHVHHTGKTHRVNGAVRVAIVVVYDLKHASSPECWITRHRLGIRMLAAHLRQKQRVTKDEPHLFRERLEIGSRSWNPFQMGVGRRQPLKHRTSSSETTIEVD